MATKKTQAYKVHQLTIDDALDLAGILAAGGLTGQAGDALAQIQSDGRGAGLTAITRLVMGALANRATRDDMRGFLFTVWKTTEDDQATDADLGITGRLEPKYSGEELDPDSVYYRKLKRFHALPPSALVGLVRAVYESDGFADFLELLRAEIPNLSTAPVTASNGTTD